MESYVISVSPATGCYCHIRIGANATLYKLHQAILNAFDFEDDHQHAFFYGQPCLEPRGCILFFQDGWLGAPDKEVCTEKGKA